MLESQANMSEKKTRNHTQLLDDCAPGWQGNTRDKGVLPSSVLLPFMGLARPPGTAASVEPLAASRPTTDDTAAGSAKGPASGATTTVLLGVPGGGAAVRSCSELVDTRESSSSSAAFSIAGAGVRARGTARLATTQFQDAAMHRLWTTEPSAVATGRVPCCAPADWVWL